MNKELIDYYLDELSKEMNEQVKTLKLRINRERNFYIPYDCIELGVTLKEIKDISETLGYRLVFSYDLDKKYYDDLLYFATYLEVKGYINPIDIKFLNSINIIQVGLDINGVRRLDIFDNDEEGNDEEKADELF